MRPLALLACPLLLFNLCYGQEQKSQQPPPQRSEKNLLVIDSAGVRSDVGTHLIAKDSVLKIVSDSLAFINASKGLLSDSTHRKARVSKAKEKLLDQKSRADGFAPTQFLNDSTLKKDRLAGTKEKVRRLAEAQAGRSAPAMDTSYIKNTVATSKEKAINYLENEIGEAAPEIQMDSSLTKTVKSSARNRLDEELGKHTSMKIQDVRLDSTLTTQLKTNITSEAVATAEKRINDDIPSLTLDSAGMSEATSFTENQVQKWMSRNTDDEIGKQKNEYEAYKNQVAQMKSDSAHKQKAIDYAKEHAFQNQEKVEQARTQIASLKKKYNQLTNSNDLTSAQKRSSLTGAPFFKRLVVGGNLNLVGVDPVTLDLAPVLGWKFNKYLEAGTYLTYRTQFIFDAKTSIRNSPEFGYGTFINHVLFKNIFAYVEYGRMKIHTETTSDEPLKWSESVLAGFGTTIKVANFMTLQTIVAYNILHDTQPGLFNSPLVFKTGIRIEK
ncbi:MAG: hypothetical protein AAGA66_00555 [Bacteroidota bacterium]